MSFKMINDEFSVPTPFGLPVQEALVKLLVNRIVHGLAEVDRLPDEIDCEVGVQHPVPHLLFLYFLPVGLQGSQRVLNNIVAIAVDDAVGLRVRIDLFLDQVQNSAQPWLIK